LGEIIEILLLSAIAGIVGMGLGGFIAAILLRSPSERMMCWLLSFAGGIMIGIVCFGLIPESSQISNTVISMVGLIIGIVVIMALNRYVDNMSKTASGDMKIHHTHEELYHASPILKNHASMLRSGIIMFIAIGLHNLPEGIAIGAGGSHDQKLGIVLAIMITLHSLPEGMAVAALLLAGRVNRWKVVLLTALSGTPTIIGGLMGILIGSISDTAVALSLSIAGGAMLYVVFGDIIPQSTIMTKSRASATITLVGIVTGLGLTLGY